MKIEESERIGKIWFEDMWSIPNLNVADEIIDENYDPVWIHINKKGAAQVKHEIKYFRSVFLIKRTWRGDWAGFKHKPWINQRF